MENIKSWSLFKSQKQNRYFFERKMERVHLCHPLFFYLLELNNNGIDIQNWIDNLVFDSESIDLKDVGRFSKQDINYYYRKFFYLKSNGYFTGVDQQKKLSGEIDGTVVKISLANMMGITFEVTQNCNLSCKYCCYGELYNHNDNRENKNLDLQSAKKLLDYLLELWNSPLNRSHDKQISIDFYGGEPLMNFPFITEIVDYARHLNTIHNRFTFSMTTNGTFLQKYMDFLYENGFEIWVSLDGNEQNDSYRMFKNGNPSYKTVMENLEALQTKYPVYFQNQVNFIAVLHNNNSVSEIHHFFKTHFNKMPAVSTLNAGGIAESQKKEFWKTYVNISQSLAESEDYSLIEKDLFFSLPNVIDFNLFLHRSNDFFFNNYQELIFDNHDEPDKPTDTCLPFVSKLFVTATGKILPCEKINHNFALGQVTPEKVKLDFEKIAGKYNDYYKKMRQQCSTCGNADLCTQCLFYIPGIEEQNPECKGFMTETDYAKYISQNISYLENNPRTLSRLLKEAKS